jgi:hypothetical protein
MMQGIRMEGRAGPMGAAGVRPTAPTERSLPPHGVGVGVGVSTGVGVGVPAPGWLLG